MALSTYLADARGGKVNRILMIAPIICSLLALTIVLGNVAEGVPRQADDGAAAHLFQLLMVAQVPLVVGFAAVANWRRPVRPLIVLAVQALAFAAALGSLAWSGY